MIKRNKLVNKDDVGSDEGISGNRQSVDALMESEEKFAKAFNLNPIPMAISTMTDGRYIDVNGSFLQLTGYIREEVIGHSSTELGISAKPGFRATMLEMMGNQGRIHSLEYEFRIKSGEVRLGLLSVETIRVGGQQCLLLILNDITEHKKTEEALRKSEERFRYVLENVQDAVWSADLSGQFEYLSPLMAHIYGRPLEEMVDNPAFWIEAAYPEDQGAACASGETLIRDGHVELEYRIVLPDGRVRWILDRKTLIRDSQGEPSRIAGIISDVTDRNNTVEALKESEAKYRMVVNNAREAIFVDAGGMFKFANGQATILTGYSQEELTSRPYAELIHPDDRQLVAEYGDRRIAGLEVPGPYTFRAIVKSGAIKWVELSAMPINWEGKPAVLSFLTDITDRKRLEEEQQRVAKLESVGLLAGGIAHDFNNILTSILGNISLASMDAADGSELQHSLEQAEKASQRAKALTAQLLTFSKGGAPVLKLASLAELLRDTAGFALSGSRVKCDFSIPADLWHAEIDQGQVSQVIHNLVINAQQAMPAGGSIEISANNIVVSRARGPGRGLPLEEGRYIRIAVTDHGIGIPGDHLEKIFDPFFTTKQKGNGMGLAISFSIARQHGGHLSVESAPGTGSTFCLYLPASENSSAPKESKKETAKPAGKARVLVMDDEKGVRETTGRMLRHIGYKDIEFASDGAEAIKLYNAAMKSGHPFNVAILDLTIPGGMGGEETIRKLIEIDPMVKAIVSSGYHEDVVMAKFKEHGFSGMVVKPYTIGQLALSLQHALG